MSGDEHKGDIVTCSACEQQKELWDPDEMMCRECWEINFPRAAQRFAEDLKLEWLAEREADRLESEWR